jgi:hypothetical protein
MTLLAQTWNAASMTDKLLPQLREVAQALRPLL